MKKRIFSILLTLCMVLLLFPVTAFAEAGNEMFLSIVGFVSGSTPDDFRITSINGIDGFSPDDVISIRWMDNDRNLMTDTEKFIGGENYIVELKMKKNGCTDLNRIHIGFDERTTVVVDASDPTLFVIECKMEAPLAVTFEFDHGTLLYSLNPMMILMGKDFSLPDLENYGAYQFFGWKIKDSEDNTIFKPGDIYESISKDMTFVAVYDEITLTVPFTTTVKQGGNVAPGKTTFELGLIDSSGNNLKYDDVYFGAEVTTDGAGSYSGTMTITAPLSWLEDMLYKGAFIWQYDGEEEGWTYDDTVWGLDLYNEEIAARSVSEVPYSLLIYPTYVMDDGSFALDLNAGQVERMTFTNTYTKTVTEPEEPDDPDDLGDPDKPKKSTKPTKPTKPQTDNKSNPSTGDNSNLALCVALLAVSAAGLIGTGVYSKRGKNSRAK